MSFVARTQRPAEGTSEGKGRRRAGVRPRDAPGDPAPSVPGQPEAVHTPSATPGPARSCLTGARFCCHRGDQRTSSPCRVARLSPDAGSVGRELGRSACGWLLLTHTGRGPSQETRQPGAPPRAGGWNVLENSSLGLACLHVATPCSRGFGLGHHVWSGPTGEGPGRCPSPTQRAQGHRR